TSLDVACLGHIRRRAHDSRRAVLARKPSARSGRIVDRSTVRTTGLCATLLDRARVLVAHLETDVGVPGPVPPALPAGSRLCYRLVGRVRTRCAISRALRA